MVNNYVFGQIIIGGKEYTTDVQVSPGKVLEWRRKSSHFAGVEDIENTELFAENKMECVVIGTGYSGAMIVPDAAREHLRAHNMEIFIEKTARAAAKYNELEKNKRRVLGLFHLTC